MGKSKAEGAGKAVYSHTWGAYRLSALSGDNSTSGPHFGCSPAKGLPHPSASLSTRSFPTETCRGERDEHPRRCVPGSGPIARTGLILNFHPRRGKSPGPGQGRCKRGCRCHPRPSRPSLAIGHFVGGGESPSAPARAVGEWGTETRPAARTKAEGPVALQSGCRCASTSAPEPGHGRAAGAAAGPFDTGDKNTREEG